MAEEVVQIKMDAELKKAAEELYQNMGMSFADAVKIFAKKSVDLGASPFFIKSRKKTAFGSLSKYANPALIPL